MTAPGLYRRLHLANDQERCAPVVNARVVTDEGVIPCREDDGLVGMRTGGDDSNCDDFRRIRVGQDEPEMRWPGGVAGERERTASAPELHGRLCRADVYARRLSTASSATRSPTIASASSLVPPCSIRMLRRSRGTEEPWGSRHSGSWWDRSTSCHLERCPTSRNTASRMASSACDSWSLGASRSSLTS